MCSFDFFLTVVIKVTCWNWLFESGPCVEFVLITFFGPFSDSRCHSLAALVNVVSIGFKVAAHGRSSTDSIFLHEKASLRFLTIKRQWKNAHRHDERWMRANSSPIVQALAPYLPAGCCAVNELVSRALFIGAVNITGEIAFVNTVIICTNSWSCILHPWTQI